MVMAWNHEEPRVGPSWRYDDIVPLHGPCRSRDALLGLDGFAAIDVSHRGEVTIVPTWSRRAWSAVSGAGPAAWGMVVTTSS